MDPSGSYCLTPVVSLFTALPPTVFSSTFLSPFVSPFPILLLSLISPLSQRLSSLYLLPCLPLYVFPFVFVFVSAFPFIPPSIFTAIYFPSISLFLIIAPPSLVFYLSSHVSSSLSLCLFPYVSPFISLSCVSFSLRLSLMSLLLCLNPMSFLCCLSPSVSSLLFLSLCLCTTV
jgi:hypothetical protein